MRRCAGILIAFSTAAIFAIAPLQNPPQKSGHFALSQNQPASVSQAVLRLHDSGPAHGRMLDGAVRLCQAECACSACSPWQPGGPGEYVDHARTAHVPVYRIRVDDMLRCVYRITRNESPRPYRLNVGDEVLVESFSDANLNRSLIIQPDGTITLRLLGQVPAAHLTVPQLRDKLETAYQKLYKAPAITVTPVRVNTKLEDLRATVDARAGTGGQGLEVRVTPDGSISLPAVGPVPLQGLTLEEAERELNLRYALVVDGIEITPILETRAPRYVYVLGEVKLPGRYVLEGPTTVMQAISMGGSWNVGANLKQIVVFRRGDSWQLMATMLDLQAALSGKCKCPAGEIWLGDGDVVLVPKSAILRADDFINLVFTRGAYGVMPFTTSYEFGLAATVLK
ncbi:MAG TPA: polysaccharide biosynthesis/export family protein [Pirellulales bacterium]|nr:polysaccharide biosynthesis/export family protein [Pirellulales bacterium]